MKPATSTLASENKQNPSLARSAETKAFVKKIVGLDQSAGDSRTKLITERLLGDLFATIEDFDISPDEFWKALNFLATGSKELGLWAAGLGIEHFLDERMDAADAANGVTGVTPRTIEGPLYVQAAPLTEGEARLDDGTDVGEILIMEGQVLDPNGSPIPDAVVDVWHANTVGNYSHFDPNQQDFHLRRRIVTNSQGRYRFRSIVPSGYGVPPNGSTDRLLRLLGRHGRRPAHIHFFVSAPSYQHLTTQINISGDPDLWDDFAYATRDGLIPEMVRHSDVADYKSQGLEAPYAHIAFDFKLWPASQAALSEMSSRKRLDVSKYTKQ